MLRVRLLAGLAVLVVGAVAVVALVSRLSNEDSSSGERRQTATLGGTFEYPQEWKTTLEAARAQVTFDMLVPKHPDANASNVTEVFLWPERHTVALRFPSPNPTTAPVRQDYLEIVETPWTGGDARSSWAEDIIADPVVGKSIILIEGVPALSVTAHSPTDISGENPAFLRFVYEGLDVHISGGESLDELIHIAESIIN
jgi:hypothetical protein